MKKPLDVIVVGAGLGGLAAAAALLRLGCQVTVLEQASELAEVGADVQLAPNAMKVLRALGLEETAIAVGFEPTRHAIRSWKSGRVLAETPYKGPLRAHYGAGYYGFHRADLQAVLASAVPSQCLRLGVKCVAVRSEPGHASVLLDDGTELHADAVIGADGIHSAVRDSLFGPESPRFTGNICWRGLVPTEAMPAGAIAPDMTVWFGPGANIVHYYVRGGRLINWVASYEADDWRSESWKVEGKREELAERFAAWHPTIRDLLAKSNHYYKWALFDRDPLPQWSSGAATLMGDAAHPMLPYLAQGACMAIEDGYAVAAALAGPDAAANDIAQALRAYEDARRGRTARVQLLARSRALENHLASPLHILKRDLGYAWRRLRSPSRHTYGIEWIYGHDVTATRETTL
ncbi:MAG: FAD-dependent monooxygenase [Janthinobacterium lividum]